MGGDYHTQRDPAVELVSCFMKAICQALANLSGPEIGLLTIPGQEWPD